jgi:hypothetical protein
MKFTHKTLSEIRKEKEHRERMWIALQAKEESKKKGFFGKLKGRH